MTWPDCAWWQSDRAVRTLLIVWHSRTGTAEQLARAIHAGAGSESAIKSVCVTADAVTTDQLLAADAHIFVCPENLGSMSGMMKEMVDRCYYDLIDRVNGRPCAIVVAAGTDGTGAVRQWQRIVNGWRLRLVADPLIVRTGADSAQQIWAPKTISPADRAAAHDLGQLVANGMALGVF